MRVLIISSLFPPFVLGGAEMAASSLATWLATHGHTVTVLTSAPQPDQVESSRRSDGTQVERRFFPNSYSIFDTKERPLLKKAGWHIRDHFNRYSEKICREVIESFKPDIVNTHDLQGIGYNLLREIGAQGLPCVQTLHDFGFLCVKMTMFHNGRSCKRRHFSCAASGWVKHRYLASIKRLSFWSPSQALLERHREHLPPHSEATFIPLPLLFSKPTPSALPSPIITRPRLLYVGQVMSRKGVDFVLAVLAELSATLDFDCVVVGSGSSLETLREKYGTASWLKFAGRVAPEAVADFMSQANLLLIPSLWFENSPLVAYQAIQLGLPILASDVGGLPELVRTGVNGELLPPGDATRWSARLRALLAAPERLRELRTGAEGLSHSFDPDILGEKVVALFERTIAEKSRHVPAAASTDTATIHA